MITWAVAYVIAKQNPWGREGTGMTLVIAMFVDIILALIIFT